jgi:protein-S-isoprenylcysteine O-methyltransferase Ste14
MANPDAAGSPIPPPLVHAGGLAIGLGIDRIAGFAPFVLLPGEWQLVLAIVLGSLGLALLLGAFGRFRKRGTAAEPWKPSTSMVTDGIYAHTRNPMYLGFAIAYFGVALAFASIGAIAMLLPVLLWMNFVQIPREEAYLKVRFGEDYTAYKARVRRWF